MKSITFPIAVLSALALLDNNSAQGQISLGTAGNFAVLGGTTVTSTGGTVLYGDLGVAPGSAITGFPPGSVSGTTYTSVNGNAAGAQMAENDALTAYNTLTGERVTQSLTGATLGSGGTIITLAPGVYYFSSSAQLTGQLVLSGSGNYIFLIGSTLTTASGSSIVLENGAQAGNVYWQVGSSATIGTDSVLAGSIIADASITMNTGADLDGRALALNGAVTLDDNTIGQAPLAAVPEPSTVLAGALMLLPLGVGALWSLRKKQVA